MYVHNFEEGMNRLGHDVIVADLEEIVSEQCSAAEARVAEGSISVVDKVMIRLRKSRIRMYVVRVCVCVCVWAFSRPPRAFPRHLGRFRSHLGRFRGHLGSSVSARDEIMLDLGLVPSLLVSDFSCSLKGFAWDT
jgi:hypothetical protein